MRIIIIVALDEKRGIGKNNGLMWNIPGELPRFKRITTGHPIIMGRKTFASIGRVLPNRTNIVITRDAKYKIEGAIIVNSLEKAIEVAKEIEESRIKNLPAGRQGQESNNENKNHNSSFMIHNSDEEEIFIIGGGQIFKEALEKNLVDKLYLTLVQGDYHADTFFPEYKKQFPSITFKETKTEGEYTYTFQNRQR